MERRYQVVTYSRDIGSDEHIISIPRREYIVTGNQLDRLLKDIKRGKVECGGFKNPATLEFDNSANERITEINE
ncbi:MAG: hypothetical protein PUJ47_03545 [Clostridia bacterium]|nr:hypothetical protein [Clostridia bacterium]